MSYTINILATHYNDYRLDYERFFFDNRLILANAGIAWPWLEQDGDVSWQRGLETRVTSLKADDEAALAEFRDILANSKSLLLAAPFSTLSRCIPDFTGILRSAPDLAHWQDARMRLVWLVPPSFWEYEGSARYLLLHGHYPPACAKILEYIPKFLHDLDNMLSSVDERIILPERDGRHVAADEIIDALGLELPREKLAPLRETRPQSREALYVQGKFRSMIKEQLHIPPSLEEELADMELPACLAAESVFSCYAPGERRTLYNAFVPQMESIAARHGIKLEMAEPADEPGWQPLDVDGELPFSALLKKRIMALPLPAKDYYARLFASKWNFAAKDFEDARIACTKPQAAAGAEPLLTVLTLAYNHEKYIGECIESVLAQQTSFPVRHLIVDDCSTDATAAIIDSYARKYPSVWPIYLGAGKFGDNVRALFDSCSSRYAALCDGDDYFTDPLKLQRQVDLLESHPDFSMCFHPVDVIYTDGSPTRVYPDKSQLPGGERPFYSLRDILQGNCIQTNSAVYRWRFAAGLPDWFNAEVVPSDWYWHLLHAEKGLVGYLPQRMAVYRRHPAALFATAEKGPAIHRARYGIQELQLYEVLDAHFRRAFHKDFQKLADGVFASLTQIFIESGDDSALVEAAEKYPLFGKTFLAGLNLKKA